MRKYIVDFISAFSGVLSTTAANRGKRCRCGMGVSSVASLQALYAFRRWPLYRLCMRGSSHPALPQRQQIAENGAVAAEAFRRCPLYRLCMRGSSHPALPQRQQIAENGAVAAEAFRRCPLYRLCMRDTLHPALPQRQRIAGNGAIAAEAD